MNQELKKIGEKLNISETDIAEIIKKSQRKKNKALKIIAYLIVVILTFILGILLGRMDTVVDEMKELENDCSYPYCMNPIFLGFLSPISKKYKFALPIITAIVFLSAHSAKPIFGLDLTYGVFCKKFF